MTDGEHAFVTFCECAGIPVWRIEESKTKEPDYQILLNGYPIIVEVKDFDLNPEEKEAAKIFEEGGQPFWGGPPGDRVRSKIDRARRQLKRMAAHGMSAILLLHDPRPFPFNNIDQYDIKVAMHGFETHVLSVPLLGRGKPRLRGKIFGKDRKMSATGNTYFSAVALLEDDQHGNSTLHIYHNTFADYPIPTELLLGRRNLKQYNLNSHPAGGFGEWVEVY